MRNVDFAGWFEVLRTPVCWLQLKTLCLEWDRELTWLMDNGYHFEEIDSYHARIGPYVLWIENHPYASFSIASLRPRRRTILRAHRQLMLDVSGERFTLHLGRSPEPVA